MKLIHVIPGSYRQARAPRTFLTPPFRQSVPLGQSGPLACSGHGHGRGSQSHRDEHGGGGGSRGDGGGHHGDGHRGDGHHGDGQCECVGDGDGHRGGGHHGGDALWLPQSHSQPFEPKQL